MPRSSKLPGRPPEVMDRPSLVGDVQDGPVGFSGPVGRVTSMLETSGKTDVSIGASKSMSNGGNGGTTVALVTLGLGGN